MDPIRLRALVAVADHGTVRGAAAATGYGPSAVSQQLAGLARETGVTLLEQQGRRLRLTPAGTRLVRHARGILAAIEVARADLGADAEPAGPVRVAAYATVLAADVLPAVSALAVSHPALRPLVQEREPVEVERLLADDDLDLGAVYDYTLTPTYTDDGDGIRAVYEVEMLLAVPDVGVGTITDLRAFIDSPWIGNSRGIADDELAARVCAPAGFVPTVMHRADDLSLVQQLIAAGLGVALLPAEVPLLPGVRVVPVPGAELRRRMFLRSRPGRLAWPPLALMARALTHHAQARSHTAS